MEKEDARFQTLEQLHERRKQVVQLHIKGIASSSIALDCYRTHRQRISI